MRCLLIGNYGVGNLGDEALREYFLQTFSNIEWTVLSAHPSRANEVPRLPCGFRSTFTPWWRTIGALIRCDAVVFGGGSLFTDSESSFACLLWWWHAFVARLFRKPLFMAFQGVGPLRTSGSTWLTKWVFSRADFISVRDEASFNRLKDWKLKTQPVLTFDPVFALFASSKRQSSERRTLVIIPRNNSGDEFFVAVSGKLASSWDSVRILLMKPGPEERHIAEQIQSMTTSSSQVVEITTQDQLLGEISVANEVVTQRYHGALAAMAMGVPVTIVPQSAGDKLQELCLLAGSEKNATVLLRRIDSGSEGLLSALRVVEMSRNCYNISNMEALRLTAAEYDLFKAIPDVLQDGWTVDVISVTDESDTELAVRARMAHFSDPAVQAAFDALRGKSAAAAEFERVVRRINIRSWNQQQMAELFFVLGVRVIGGFMEHILSEAKTGEDLEALSAFSVIRDKLASLNAPSTL